MKETPLLSIVSPVFGAERIVAELVRRIIDAVRPLGTFEIVLVDDRSRDNGWMQIREQTRLHEEVVGIRLSRNSGQHAAIAAGLAQARGEFVVVMDCDLQDDPSEIPMLLSAARAGHDIVLTNHATRRHARFRNLGARLYLWMIALLTGDESETVGRGSFSLLSRKVVDSYNSIGDIHAHYLVNIKYLGFDQTTIEVTHDSRFEGVSSYTFGRLMRHFADGVVANSVRVLNLVIVAGLGLFGLSLLGVVGLLVNYIVRGALAGFTSIMVVFLLMTGAVLCSVGVVGIYVGRIFELSRGRPRYFIDERVEGDGHGIGL